MATRKAKTTKATTPAKTTRPVKKTERTQKVVSPKIEKKAVEKKSVEKKVTDKSVVANSSTSQKSTRRLPAFTLKKSYVIAALLLLALAGLLYFYRSLFIVATVNGQPINRLAYIQELERMSGQQALNALVTKNLILQEAGKKDVSVTDEEVDTEISKIDENLKSQGQNLDSVLTLQGLTREALREQIYLQKLIEKMVGDSVKVSDEEVTTYIENNQETLPEGQTEEDQQVAVREQLRQQKLNEKVQTWLQELQQNAKINYLIQR